jgi:hypothetical protein
MTDPIDIKDQCVSISIEDLRPDQPYHFRWLGYDMYLFLDKDNLENKPFINIYQTDD